MEKIPASIPKKYRDIIEHFDDERNAGNGYIVTLKYGWTIDPVGHQGVFGEDRVSDVISKLGEARPCKCAQCVEELARQPA